MEIFSYLNSRKKENLKKYINCLNLLGKSLNKYNKYLNIATGKDCQKFLQENIQYAKVFVIQENYFNNNLRLFSEAHGKFDLFKYIEENDSINNFLILDSDVICLRNPTSIEKKISTLNKSFLLFYNLYYDQLKSYGSEKVIKALNISKYSKKDNFKSDIWAGGEFLIGNKSSIKFINKYIKENFQSYCDNAENFHHIGDEVLLSRAIISLSKDENFYLENSLYIQRIWTLKVYGILKSFVNKKAIFMHYPDSKRYFPFIFNNFYLLKVNNIYLINFLIYIKSKFEFFKTFIKRLS